MGPEYPGYKEVLKKGNIDKLGVRRHTLSYKSEKYSNWFCPNLEDTHNQIQTRSGKLPLKPKHAITLRYAKSPLVYLTNILNEKLQKLSALC